jgi:hypothetical protein
MAKKSEGFFKELWLARVMVEGRILRHGSYMGLIL